MSALSALLRYKPAKMTVSLPDDEGNFRVKLSEPSLLVAVGNAPTYGNGMKMAPKARLDDGQLDVCFVRNATKRRVLSVLHTIFSGRHVELPEVEYFRARHLWLESDTRLAIYADGEYVCDTPAEFRVRPASLRVIVPS